MRTHAATFTALVLAAASLVSEVAPIGRGAVIGSNTSAIGISTVLGKGGVWTEKSAGTLARSGRNDLSGGTLVNSSTLAGGYNNARGTGKATANARKLSSLRVCFQSTTTRSIPSFWGNDMSSPSRLLEFDVRMGSVLRCDARQASKSRTRRMAPC